MKSFVFGITTVVIAAMTSGCASTSYIMSSRDAIPAYRLPPELKACSRENEVSIDLSLLTQKRPKGGHHVAAGDLLGVYVAGVLPPKIDDQATTFVPQTAMGPYYPPYGRIYSPATGIPIEVRTGGNVRLPLVGKLDLNDKTMDEATDIIRLAYEKAGVIQEDRERVIVSILRPRVRRVVVLRDDAQSPVPTFLSKTAVPFTKIGRGEVVDLPAYENDIAHALATTGGLPGLDVFSEVWIFRHRDDAPNDVDAIHERVTTAESAESVANQLKGERELIRIPLRICPGEPLPFTEEDILLEDGDVLYLPPRETENFYSGGQLPGGKIPLPRDHDLDILEAIALVNGSTGGPGSSGSIFRTGPGYVLPATKVLVVRKLPNGQQVRIRVDLNKALHDPNERLIVQADDQVLLFFTPTEFYGNLLLNFVGFTVNIIPK